MILFKKDGFKKRPIDFPLVLLFSFIIIAILCCSILAPKMLQCTSGVINHAYWMAANIGKESHHLEMMNNSINPKLTDGSVTIMFDDGWETQYTSGYKIMKEFGFKGSISVISDYVNMEGYMNIKQLSLLYRQGWDMANHSKSHKWLNELSLSNQRNELDACRRWLELYSLTGAEDIAVFPGGFSNQNTFKALNKLGFTVARGIDDYWDVPASTRLSDIVIVSVTPALSDQAIENIIITAKEKKHPLILIFHKIDTKSDKLGMSYPPEKLKKICSLIKQNKLQVLTISQLYKCEQRLSEQRLL